MDAKLLKAINHMMDVEEFEILTGKKLTSYVQFGSMINTDRVVRVIDAACYELAPEFEIDQRSYKGNKEACTFAIVKVGTRDVECGVSAVRNPADRTMSVVLYW